MNLESPLSCYPLTRVELKEITKAMEELAKNSTEASCVVRNWRIECSGEDQVCTKHWRSIFYWVRFSRWRWSQCLEWGWWSYVIVMVSHRFWKELISLNGHVWCNTIVKEPSAWLQCDISCMAFSWYGDLVFVSPMYRGNAHLVFRFFVPLLLEAFTSKIFILVVVIASLILGIRVFTLLLHLLLLTVWILHMILSLILSVWRQGPCYHH